MVKVRSYTGFHTKALLLGQLCRESPWCLPCGDRHRQCHQSGVHPWRIKPTGGTVTVSVAAAHHPGRELGSPSSRCSLVTFHSQPNGFCVFVCSFLVHVALNDIHELHGHCSHLALRGLCLHLVKELSKACILVCLVITGSGFTEKSL